MKISREKLRALIQEQVGPEQSGPFLVLVFDEDSRKTQVFITKVLPDDQWWHAPSDELDAADMGMAPGFGGREDVTRVTIYDMSQRDIQTLPGAPASFISFINPVREL